MKRVALKKAAMKMEFILSVIAASALLLPLSSFGETADELTLQARQQTKAFAEDLKSTLMKGMKAEGPEAAIMLCNEEAPEIAASHSKAGWDIGRTSLKIRNPDNAPDEWETTMLLDFAKRQQAGEELSTMEASMQDGDTFRYMKAIPVGGPCVICHGENLAPAVKNKLSSLYPDDQATGYSMGDLRGAFTLTYTAD